MITYKEYAKECLEKAKEHDYFDENGNSTTATANRGFVKEMSLDVKRLFICFIDVDFKQLAIQLLGVLIIILSPVLFIPLLITRSYFSRKRAKKELMEYYVKDIVNKKDK